MESILPSPVVVITLGPDGAEHDNMEPNNNNKSNTPNIVNIIVLPRILPHVFDCTSSTSANYSTNAVVITRNSDNVSAPAIPSRRNTDTFQRFR